MRKFTEKAERRAREKRWNLKGKREQRKIGEHEKCCAVVKGKNTCYPELPDEYTKIGENLLVAGL